MNEPSIYIPALLFFTIVVFAIIIFSIASSKREEEIKKYSLQLRCNEENYKCLKYAYNEQSKEILELKRQKVQEASKEFSNSLGKHIVIEGVVVYMETDNLNSDVTLTVEKEDAQIFKVVIPTRDIKF